MLISMGEHHDADSLQRVIYGDKGRFDSFRDFIVEVARKKEQTESSSQRVRDNRTLSESEPVCALVDRRSFS